MSLSDKLTGSLWDRIAGFFVKMWDEFWHATINDLEWMATAIIEAFIGRKGYKAYLNMVNTLSNNLDDLKLPDHVQKQIDTFAKTGGASAATGSFLYMLMSEFSYWLNVLPTMMGKEKLELNKEYEPSPIDLGTLTLVYYKMPAYREYVIEKGRENGLSKEDVEMIFKASQSLLSLDQIRDLYLRGLISDDEVTGAYKRLGYQDTDIEKLKELFYYIPTVEDLVTMSVRECFDPDIVAHYGQDQDFPDSFLEYAKKKGVSEFWAHKYWQAHWNLPSISDGFEMLHRGIISLDEMKKLLRTQDVMPYWRDKLIQIAYTPYYRVDIRRMYADGVLTEDDVLDAYQEIGYDLDKAKKLTEWTVKEYGKEVSDVTKSEILTAYYDYLIDEDTAKSYLKEIGLSDERADLEIEIINYRRHSHEQKEELKLIEEKYKAGLIDDTGVQDELGKLDLPSKQTEYLLTKWTRLKYHKTKQLTISQIHELFKKGIINDNELSNELANLGYSKKYRDWLIQLYRSERIIKT